MKHHSVTLDGKVCSLNYTVDDRETIEGMYPRPDGTPGSMGAMARDNLIGAGSFRVQVALVWVGVRHLGAAWTFDRVREAMVKATQNGGIGAILRPTYDEILASGCLGRAFVERAADAVQDTSEEDPGKAKGTPEAGG